MEASLAEVLEEFCSNCGEWVSYLHFNYETGWCNECSQVSDIRPRCNQCGDVLPDRHRTTCPTCRRERWYVKHTDELEFLIVVKSYTLAKAVEIVTQTARPICQCCGKIIYGADDRAIFCKRNRECRSAYLKFKRLRKSGLTIEQALATVRPETPKGVSGSPLIPE